MQCTCSRVLLHRPLAARALHAAAAPRRHDRASPVPSTSTAAPVPRRRRDPPFVPGLRRWSKSPALPSRASSRAALSPLAVQEKLVNYLKRVWIKHDSSLVAFARDLGLDPARFAALADRFARTAIRELAPTHQWPPKTTEWDRDALVADCNQLGTTTVTAALQPHAQRAFVLWAATHLPPPAPTPSALQPDPTLSKLQHLAALTDFRFPGEAFPEARQLRRKIFLHVGPTNSGKTHAALVALARARSGCYAGPLRLLAHEVFTRFNAGTIGDEGPRVCNLVTGEEQRLLDPTACLSSCTVEMFPIGKRLDVAVVDEIQMIGDPQRGTAWTNVLLGSQCTELHLCGEESVVDLVQAIAASLGDECVVKRYQRLSPLAVARESLRGDLKKIRPGDCLVTFSRTNIFAFKRMVEERTGLRVAVAYGGLPPEVREEQARAFNEGAYDVLVASDAVGMGLNLKIRRIVFESLHKWDGTKEVPLSMPQIKQIAGRAGRFGVHTSPTAPDDGDALTTTTLGEVTTLEQVDMKLLREAIQAPVVQVEKAVLSPLGVAVSDVQALLPPTTRLSTVLHLVATLARTSPLYTMGSSVGAFPVLDALHPVQPLTVDERATLGASPVNARDKMVLSTVVTFAQSFAAGQRVHVRDWATGVGLLDLLARVQDKHAALPAPDSADATRKKALRLAASLSSPGQLQTLESCHRCLTLYLWLAYRNADIFHELEDARQLRRDVESAIQVCLASTKFKRIERRKASAGTADWGPLLSLDVPPASSGRARL